MKRIPQPPIDPALRDRERHAFASGFVAAAAGLLLVLFALRHLTGVETVKGQIATEIQLVKAFSSSGLQFADDWSPPPPPQLSDPEAQAAALDRWAKNQADARPPTWKVRVDTAAAAPCPT
ncbi:MAG TPA: hypothetical protein VFV81_07130 [Verrucomicrobiae bacterium]|nr:hypothetical protein [Verrucomicrobiae bacterium]